MSTPEVKTAAELKAQPDEFRTAKETFRAELINERRNRFFSAYMSRAKERMAIEIDQDVVRRVVGIV